MKTIKR